MCSISSLLPRSLCFCCTSSSVEFDWERLEGILQVEQWSREENREEKYIPLGGGTRDCNCMYSQLTVRLRRWGTSYYAVLSFLSFSSISSLLLFYSSLCHLACKQHYCISHTREQTFLPRSNKRENREKGEEEEGKTSREWRDRHREKRERENITE